MIIRITAIWMSLSAASFAQSCPPVPDLFEERAALFEALKAARDEPTGKAAADAIWQIWTTAPDAKAQRLLDRGMASLQNGDFARSESILEDLVHYCPEYAEGWNQRAFARYLRGNFIASESDILRTLELEPNHFGALAGLAMIKVRLGEISQAESVLRKAISIHPWLKERAFLRENTEKDI